MIFTKELLVESRQKILHAESQRKVTTALGKRERTLKKRLKVMSTDWSPGAAD
jgi:hypothetical protein